MRIIAGTKRGMKLFSPEGMDTRPITDRVKESVFNILYSKGYLEGRIVADLFCGTGSMGLEALSRGAAWATFVDRDHRVVDMLKRNIQKADFVEQSKAVCANIFRVGAPPTPEHGFYDLVFVDPPYKMSESCESQTQVGKLMGLLVSQVRDSGMVILRTHERAVVEPAYGELVRVDQRSWGTMTVNFYCKGQPAGRPAVTEQQAELEHTGDDDEPQDV
ncbi:MAG: 16S rRNA (guanine(966)-N(2))-methyltransferase RsmD [Sedimentisphaerales bacterium]|nr:16S rRNA (guanine(966)-N(2))-methyltransferase RsmD [Sedimentisphaerales bacterium]